MSAAGRAATDWQDLTLSCPFDPQQVERLRRVGIMDDPDVNALEQEDHIALA